MGKYLRLIFVFGISLLIGLIPYNPSEFFISTIFNVSGIIFSVGLGLIVTFNMNGIKNRSIISSVRANLSTVRNSFILYFAISILAYIINNYLIAKKITTSILSVVNFEVCLYWSLSISAIMLYSIIYFVYNFFKIQKLNEEIYDEINK